MNYWCMCETIFIKWLNVIFPYHDSFIIKVVNLHFFLFIADESNLTIKIYEKKVNYDVGVRENLMWRNRNSISDLFSL